MNNIFMRRLVAGILAVCFAAGISGCMFTSGASKKYYRLAEKKQYDVIIVPGVPFENALWSRTMKGRVYWAKFLYDKGITKNIMFSGSAVYSPYYEGKIMAQYAIALGIPADHVFTENKAEHSTENVYYSYKLSKKMGFSRLALASDPFQTKQLRRYIRRKVSADIDIIPFVVDTLKVIEPGMIDPPIDYKQSFKENFTSITRREGMHKRWRGTRGKNVDKQLYE